MMTIEHFTHPSHPLTYISSNTWYHCNGCWKTGTGSRYRCGTCDFDLHEYCGTCPRTLQSSFMHPMHPLTQYVAQPRGARHVEHVCNICGTCVDGMFYRCNACNFDAHPLCTQLLQYTRHPFHPYHYLRLQPLPGPFSSGRCAVCGTASLNAWGYTCSFCDFDIHLTCFNSAPVGPVYVHSGSSSGSNSRTGSLPGFGYGWSLGSAFFNGYQTLTSVISDDSGNDLYSIVSMIIQWTLG